jgi:hypothetical protein
MAGKLSAPIVTKKLNNRLRGSAALALPSPPPSGGSMMLFDRAGRPAAAVLGIAMLAGLLSLGGCSDSTTGATSGRSGGDKSNDPTLKASMQKSLEERFKSATPVKKVNPGLGPGKLR